MLIHITAERITVTCSYQPMTVAKLKSVGGGRWDGVGKAWSFPISKLESLYRAFPDATYDDSCVSLLTPCSPDRMEAARKLCRLYVDAANFDISVDPLGVHLLFQDGTEYTPTPPQLIEYEAEIRQLIESGEEFRAKRQPIQIVDGITVPVGVILTEEQRREMLIWKGYENAAKNERKQVAIARRRYTQSMRKERV